MIFEYPHATVLRVIDGDTFWASLDLGLRLSQQMKVRIRGINAPELKDAAGPTSAEWLAARLPPGTPVALRSHAWSYDRLECDVLAAGEDIAAALLAAGQAQAVKQ